MKVLISYLLFLYLLFPSKMIAQSSLRFLVRDNNSNEILIGATVSIEGTNLGTVVNEEGEAVFNNLKEGIYQFIIQQIGYQKETIRLELPVTNDTILVFLKNEIEEELEEIVVQATRSNRSIANIPTRVEVLTEEIDEAATMDPSKVAHLLTHSTGIQVQQTSATSNTANVRIQGLDGRYTQILKDGFPLYGGFSGSLSVMQIPPLDLRQIEYIKGGASTLYGGGAIAGLINILTKEPESNETIVHLNASQVGAMDVNMFASRKYNNVGFTLLAQRNTHKAFDADKDGFTDLPQLVKYNFNPKLVFYLNKNTNLSISGAFTEEERQGGDTKLLHGQVIDSTHFYKERNEVDRVTTQVKLEHRISNSKNLTFRNSMNLFNRSMLIVPEFFQGEYQFAGKQTSSFSELSYSYLKNKNVLVAGLNFYTDNFSERFLQSKVLRDENLKTLGGFINYVFDLGQYLSFETGLRTDYVVNDKLYVLPRIFSLVKWLPNLTTRIGGGLGYRAASIFNQEAEILAYKNVLPINRATTTAERSFGGSADLGYRFSLSEKVRVHLNQMFFYSYLNEPLILNSVGTDYEFINAKGFTRSTGGETFVKIMFYDFTFFLGYTLTEAAQEINGVERKLSLTPRHSIKGDLLYSLPGKWRIGADYEYKSQQYLSNGKQSLAYWTYGLLVERYVDKFTLFGNIENIFNYRQTKKESLKSGPYNTPQFTEVWAPLDGFVFNVGLKIKLL